jgi:molybdopterin molybdotransferase
MISEEEALGIILAATPILKSEPVKIGAAMGRYLAENIVAQYSMPRFDNSSMDGYAVEAASVIVGDSLRVIGVQPAGRDLHRTIERGTAIRIFTGAPMPAGANAVVMQEDVTRQDDLIFPKTEIDIGENVRERGSEILKGEVLVEAGTKCSPQVVALLASQGFSEIAAAVNPRVAILSTGDELTMPGSALEEGCLFDSNGPLLCGLAAHAGAEVRFLGIAKDDMDELKEKLRTGLHEDFLLVTGGVSVGERDLVREALSDLGVQIDLWRVSIKPGKPFLFGRGKDCLVFGMPGNPVSTFVTFLRFVRPAILKVMAARDLYLPLFEATLGEELTNPSDRPHYLRGEIRRGVFRTIGRQESHALFGLSRSNALLRLAPGESLAAEAKVVVSLVN